MSKPAFRAIVLTMLAVGMCLGRPSARQQPMTGSPPTHVILLGSGTPVPDPEAWGPASAVVVGERLFLVDAGAGVTRRLAAAGFPRVKEVEATFISHLHSDHTLGYPDLIFTTWIMGRRGPLAVYGPPGLRQMTDRLLQAWNQDIELRVKGLERETRGWLQVDVHEMGATTRGGAGRGLSPGKAVTVYNRAGVKVTAVAVPHGDWPAFAFRFDTPGRSITFSGDTAPTPALDVLAAGTDVLVHESYNSGHVAAEDRPGGEHWPEYLHTYHTSDIELGRLAARVKPKLLVLNHVLRLGGTEAEMIEHVRAGGYQGPLVIGRDLARF